MKKIQELVDLIDDELEGAKDYAEKYIEFKTKGDSTWASKFKEMSSQELVHATNIHDLAVREIEEISKVFKAPESMQDEWKKSHAHYVECEAWIRQMLAM